MKWVKQHIRNPGTPDEEVFEVGSRVESEHIPWLSLLWRKKQIEPDGHELDEQVMTYGQPRQAVGWSQITSEEGNGNEKQVTGWSQAASEEENSNEGKSKKK